MRRSLAAQVAGLPSLVEVMELVSGQVCAGDTSCDLPLPHQLHLCCGLRAASGVTLQVHQRNAR